MSEYQYFEFRAIDTPLTRDQIADLRKYSSRASITPTSFVNEYHWGDFKGDEIRWMEQYFDAFLYFANWGTRRLMLRIPADLIGRIEAYEAGEGTSFWVKGSHAVLSYHFRDESGSWYEEEGGDWLSEMLPLRAELMSGDNRCLYLGWLAAVEAGEVPDEEEEPPVPAGLAEMSEAQEAFCAFFRVRLDLVAAAAEHSARMSSRKPSPGQIARWVAALDTAEKNTILAALVEGKDTHLAARLRARAQLDICGDIAADCSSETRRTAAELLSRAGAFASERQKRETEEQARREAARKREEAKRREQHLQRLEGQEEKLWTQVEALVQTKQPKRYDAAVELLVDLRDLGKRSTKQDVFEQRLRDLGTRHSQKRSFIKRLEDADLAV